MDKIIKDLLQKTISYLENRNNVDDTNSTDNPDVHNMPSTNISIYHFHNQVQTVKLN